MARVSDSSRTTLFQLEALVSALVHGSFEAAASQLGVRDKHRLVKAVERLAENLRVEGLVHRIGDELVVPSDVRGLESSANDVLGAISEFQRALEGLRSRTVIVRCLAYPSMVTIFVADAVNRFEALGDGPRREVRFLELESTNRHMAGAAMLRPLVSRVADVAIAPTRPIPGEPGLIQSRLVYRWQIVAAIHDEHPLQDLVFDWQSQRALDISVIAPFPLALSPIGHKTRDLLEPHEPVHGFNVELETLNSQARAALGRFGARVPLIASDSLDCDFNPAWPAVVVRDPGSDDYYSLGDTHSIYWRTDLSDEVALQVREFSECVFDAAEQLRNRPGGRIPD